MQPAPQRRPVFRVEFPETAQHRYAQEMEHLKGRFEDPNALEAALIKTSEDPKHQALFYGTLIKSIVYVIGWRVGPDGQRLPSEGNVVFTPGEQIAIPFVERADGKTLVPFYSSMRWLNACNDSTRPSMMIRALDLFELTKGSSLVLNQGAPLGKDFSPAEIAAILSVSDG